MGFDITMHTRGASDSNTILTQYQKITPAFGKDTLQSGTSVRYQTSAANPVSRPVSNPQTVQQAVRPAAGGVSLRRGEKFSITDTARLKLLFRWNVRDSRCDLDASAFLLGGQEKVPAESWFIFYGQQVSPDRSVQYSGNNGTGAEMLIDLQKVSPFIQKITLAVTMYEAFERHLHFGMVQSLEADIINADTNRGLAHFILTDCSSQVTAMVAGELYRYKGAWKFNAVGSGVHRDLAGFCAMYGIETG